MPSFCAQLLAQRKALGLNQADMAKALGVPFRTYRRYESGESEPTLPILCKIADYFNVSIDYLAGRSTTRDRQP